MEGTNDGLTVSVQPLERERRRAVAEAGRWASSQNLRRFSLKLSAARASLHASMAVMTEARAALALGDCERHWACVDRAESMLGDALALTRVEEEVQAAMGAASAVLGGEGGGRAAGERSEEEAQAAVRMIAWAGSCLAPCDGTGDEAAPVLLLLAEAPRDGPPVPEPQVTSWGRLWSFGGPSARRGRLWGAPRQAWWGNAACRRSGGDAWQQRWRSLLGSSMPSRCDHPDAYSRGSVGLRFVQVSLRSSHAQIARALGAALGSSVAYRRCDASIGHCKPGVQVGVEERDECHGDGVAVILRSSDRPAAWYGVGVRYFTLLVLPNWSRNPRETPDHATPHQLGKPCFVGSCPTVCALKPSDLHSPERVVAQLHTLTRASGARLFLYPDRTLSSRKPHHLPPQAPSRPGPSPIWRLHRAMGMLA